MYMEIKIVEDGCGNMRKQIKTKLGERQNGKILLLISLGLDTMRKISNNSVINRFSTII